MNNALRPILLIHRYLAVAVGLLMTLWCLSGFVMMYQSYPSVGAEQRLAGLEPLDLTGCCDFDRLAASGAVGAGSFQLEMLRGEPVLRLGGGRGRGAGIVSLRTGEPVGALSMDEVLDVAARHAAGNGIGGSPRLVGRVDMDQWTIQTAPRNQPAYLIAFDDPAGSEVYVSGASGEVFQATNRRVRVLGWLGAIPHWLYPTLLRQHGPVWLEVVIWTAVLGTFLAATGLYVGIVRLRRRGDGRLESPFRGWWYWHHMSGLVFGVLALTWVFSGLMTVNPWGMLAGGGGGGYAGTLRGSVGGAEALRFLEHAAGRADELRGYRQLQTTSFDGRLYVLARGPGNERRLDAEARLAPALTRDEVVAAAAGLTSTPLEVTLLEDEDSYYYGHKRDVELPVYRLILDDAERTRVYIAPESGSVRAVGATGRLSRWIRTGLHDFDFAGVRIRPVWDIVVILLLVGVTAVCATGTWMAFKRVRRDLRMLRRRIARRARRMPAWAAAGRGG